MHIFAFFLHISEYFCKFVIAYFCLYFGLHVSSHNTYNFI